MAVSPTNAPFYMPSAAGGITQQNQNLTNLNETPEEAVLRLSSGDLATDQIAQLTGVPPDQVAMIINTGDPQYLSQITTPAQRPSFEGIGIDSILPDTETQELSEFVDQGNSMTDFVTSQLGVEGSLQDYLREDEMVEAMANLGVDRDEADAEILDGQPTSDDTRLKQVEAASLAGGAALGVEDPDAVQTINTTNQIQQSFDPYDPDDVKAKLGVYRTAAESFFGTDDLEEFIPQPDKALPFLVAGAALINAGHHGHSWGEALSTSFLNYATTKRKEEKDYEKSILGLKLQDKRAIQQFAMQLYLSDYEHQRALQKTLLTQESSPFKVNDEPNPRYLNVPEKRALSQEGNSVVPWTAADGDIKDYTIFTDADGDGRIDANAPTFTKLLTAAGAANEQAKGWIVREGNLLKDTKQYLVNDVPVRYTDEEITAFQRENPDAVVKLLGAASATPVRLRDGTLTHVDKNELLTKEGLLLYQPIGEPNLLVYDDNDNLILAQGQAGTLSAFSDKAARTKEATRLKTVFQANDEKTNTLISTYHQITKLIDEHEASGKPISFAPGAAGFATIGKRIIDEVDQMRRPFQDPKKGYAFYNDINGNGIRDPNEKAQSLTEFGAQFDTAFGNSNLGAWFKSTGMGKNSLNNMILTLAIQSAAIDNMKGRDISDKDIERFLSRAGQNATNATEFKLVVGDLVSAAIRKSQTIVDTEVRYPMVLGKTDEGEPITVLDQVFPDIVNKHNNQLPFRGAPWTMGELGELLDNQTQLLNNTDYRPRPVTKQEAGSGGNERSGIKQNSVHDIYEEYASSANPMAYLSQLRKNFSTDENPDLWKTSLEYAAILRYIEQQRRVGEAQ